MAVYVDHLLDWGWRLGRSCHLVADSEVELHAFARRLGLKRAWFQEPPKASVPHYDLTARRRVAAITAGAIELDRASFVQKIREIRVARDWTGW